MRETVLATLVRDWRCRSHRNMSGSHVSQSGNGSLTSVQKALKDGYEFEHWGLLCSMRLPHHRLVPRA